MVLARADNYPDALVGTARLHREEVAAVVRAGRLFDLADAGGNCAGASYLLGGTAAIPASVATTLTGLGFNVVRYAAPTATTLHSRSPACTW